MTITIKALTVGAAALALAACGGKGGEKAEAPAPAAVTSDTVRPGLWEYAVSMAGSDPQTARTCADAAHGGPFMGPAQCSNVQRTKTADGVWTIAGSCDAGPNGVLTLSGEMRGDLQTSYSITMTTAIKGAANAALNGSQTATINAKWLAETCPAGLPPGAIETPQGIIDSSAVKSAP